MRINTNVAALNAQRNLAGSEVSMRTSLERLSSGLRINRAADDAAGLSISEKLRGQVRGLNQAVSNAQDTINLIGTAEGAMNESTAIIQRMRELAVQSANDTNTDLDRASIQDEVTALKSELNRIAGTTQYNGKNLLDGSFNGTFQIGANAGQTVSTSIDDMSATSLGRFALEGRATSTGGFTAGALTLNGYLGSSKVDITATDSAQAVAKMINDKTSSTGITAIAKTEVVGSAAITTAQQVDFWISTGTSSGSVAITANVQANDGDGSLVNAINAQSSKTGVTAKLDSANKLVLTSDKGENIVVGGTTVPTGLTAGTNFGQVTFESSRAFSTAEGAATGVGAATAGSSTRDTISKIDLATVDGATKAVRVLDKALEGVSRGRSGLGALQNRLQSTINNLSVASENLSNAESRIRDVDFAKEVVSMTRAQILQQSGSSILSQANQLPQSALSLLR
jgi:flagellin